MFDEILGPSADPFAIALQMGLLAAIVATAWYLIHSRCRSLIVDWAEQGGWQVVAMRRCIVATGPFAFVPGLPVYRVELSSRSGRIREAYIRCGNMLTSVLADEVAVEWADAAA